jgi:hypothetical protein
MKRSRTLKLFPMVITTIPYPSFDTHDSCTFELILVQLLSLEWQFVVHHTNTRPQHTRPILEHCTRRTTVMHSPPPPIPCVKNQTKEHGWHGVRWMDGCNKVTTEQHVALQWQWAYYYNGSMDGWPSLQWW